MTAINERKRTRSYIYARKGKRFYIHKKHDNSPHVFIYKKDDTLLCVTSYEIFEVVIYISKAWNVALRDVFIYKKPDTSQKARQFALRFYIQNI